MWDCEGWELWDCEGWELWGWETWQDKSSSAGGADGAKVRGHSTSMPGTPHGHGIATSEVNMWIIVKFSEAMPCVKLAFSRTSGQIYIVT